MLYVFYISLWDVRSGWDSNKTSEIVRPYVQLVIINHPNTKAGMKSNVTLKTNEGTGTGYKY